jgi:hypothetical protein
MDYNDVLLAAYNGEKIINLSWTSGCFYSQLQQDVMTEVASKGAFVIASAGNGNTCGSANALVYPASYGHVFSVTSVGPTNNHERYLGDPTSTHQHNDSVDLAAPGYDVAISPAPGWYLNSSGTSFAAAYVSGTVALMLAANECISNLQIEKLTFSLMLCSMNTLSFCHLKQEFHWRTLQPSLRQNHCIHFLFRFQTLKIRVDQKKYILSILLNLGNQIVRPQDPNIVY